MSASKSSSAYSSGIEHDVHSPDAFSRTETTSDVVPKPSVDLLSDVDCAIIDANDGKVFDCVMNALRQNHKTATLITSRHLHIFSSHLFSQKKKGVITSLPTTLLDGTTDSTNLAKGIIDRQFFHRLSVRFHADEFGWRSNSEFKVDFLGTTIADILEQEKSLICTNSREPLGELKKNSQLLGEVLVFNRWCTVQDLRHPYPPKRRLQFRTTLQTRFTEKQDFRACDLLSGVSDWRPGIPLRPDNDDANTSQIDTTGADRAVSVKRCRDTALNQCVKLSPLWAAWLEVSEELPDDLTSLDGWTTETILTSLPNPLAIDGTSDERDPQHSSNSEATEDHDGLTYDLAEFEGGAMIMEFQFDPSAADIEDFLRSV